MASTDIETMKFRRGERGRLSKFPTTMGFCRLGEALHSSFAMGLIRAASISAIDNRFRTPAPRVEMFGNEFRWGKKVFNPSGINMTAM